MKKIMRIALVFALAGATLVGCTKDYSGDIQDLNKKASEQQAAITALQSAVANAQTAADAAAQKAAEALAEAQKKATPADVQAAEERVNAKINDLVNGDVKALKDAVAALEAIEAEERLAALEGIDADTRLTALETAIKDFVTKAELAQELGALKGELEQAIKDGDKVNADAIAALETKVNELINKVYADVWAINAPAAVVEINYVSTNFDPTKGEEDAYKALATAFPEVKDLEGKDLTFGGSVPFAVNPDTFTFDSTFTFKFFDAQGKEFPATLSDPTPGLDSTLKVSAGYIKTAPKTKAAVGGYWTLSFEPAGVKGIFAEADGLSLVATKGEQVAATEFAYKVTKDGKDNDVDIILTPNRIRKGEDSGDTYEEYWAEFSDEINIVGAKSFVNFEHIFDGKYIISAEQTPANILAVEKYGVEFPKAGEDGIKVTNFPEGETFIAFDINVKALGYNGSTDEDHFTIFVYKKATPGTLDAKEVTYTDSTQNVQIRWAIKDYIKTAAGKKAFFEADYQTLVFVNKKDSTAVNVIYRSNKAGAPGNGFRFYDAEGNKVRRGGDNWAKAETFGFDIENDADNFFVPGEYDVYFLVNNPGKDSKVNDIEHVGVEWRRWWRGYYPEFYRYYTSTYSAPEAGTVVYVAETTLTVANDEALAPEKLMKLLPEVCKDGVVQAVGKADGTNIEYDFKDPGHQVIVTNEAFEKLNNVEIVGYVDRDLYKADSTDWFPNLDNLIEVPVAKKYVENKTVRNLAAVVRYFRNDNNVAYFPFQLTILSAVEDGVKFATNDPEIAFTEVKTSTVKDSVKVNSLFKSGENVTITNGIGKGTTLKIEDAIGGYGKYINSVAVTLKEHELPTADRFLKPNTSGKFEWKEGDSIVAQTKYTGADIPEGYVLIDAEIKVVDNWGLVTTKDFTIKVWAKKK